MSRKSKYEPKPFEARSGDHRFFSAYRSMIDAESWVHLSGNAWKLYTVLKMQYTGLNNQIVLTYAQARERTGISRKGLASAFKELEESGYIRTVKRGGLVNGGKNPNVYALSDAWKTKPP